MKLLEDMHVHSTYSDGKNSLEENVWAARWACLERLGCVDHVRANTQWLPQFVEHVRKLDGIGGVSLTVGVEAKLLTRDGELDLPSDLAGVDVILAADHRLPLGDELLTPSAAKAGLREGQFAPEHLIEAEVQTYLAVMNRYESRVRIAHPFSFLRQAGVEEALISDQQLNELCQRAAATKASFEVSERWRCPSARVVSALFSHGVEVVVSTDSHRAKTIGQYDWVKATLELDAGST